MTRFIGIDVSKDDLSLSYGSQTESVQATIPNSKTGINQMISGLDPQDHCILEATGTYHYLLCEELKKAEIPYSIINPRQSNYFARAMQTITKTDPDDARMLALYGERMKPAITPQVLPQLAQLRQRRALLIQLKKQLRAMENLQHAFGPIPQKDPFSMKCLEKHIRSLKKHIKQVQAQIHSVTKQEFNQLFVLVSSIPGIGAITASELIMASNAFHNFTSPKAFAKFIGIAPTCHQSGSSVRKKSHINRSGDPYLRSLLYICAWTAIHHNADCKELYQRLKTNGKASKLALMAVANKLIRQVFAVVKKQTPYQDDFAKKHRKITRSTIK